MTPSADDPFIGMRILLVEDDATIAEFVARGLHEAGFMVDPWKKSACASSPGSVCMTPTARRGRSSPRT